MTNLLAMMAVCIPASSMIDTNTPMQLPVPYVQDHECPCGNSGRIGGVWLNYYSPCRYDDTTIVLLAEPFPLPPLRGESPNTQLHPILHPSVYFPSLNPYFMFDLWGNLIHPYHDHYLLDYLLESSLLDHGFNDDAAFIGGFSKYDSGNYNSGADRFALTTAVVPEPGTLALLATGMIAVVRRRKAA